MSDPSQLGELSDRLASDARPVDRPGSSGSLTVEAPQWPMVAALQSSEPSGSDTPLSGPSPWEPTTAGPFPPTTGSGEKQEHPSNPFVHDAPAPQWTPLWTPVTGSEATAPGSPDPGTVGPMPPSIRYDLPPNSFRNAMWAVVAVIVATIVTSFAADRVLDRVTGGTLPAFLVSAAVLLMTNVIVLGALHRFGIRRGVSTRNLGLTAPKDRTTATVLAGATWIAFIFMAAIWVVVTTPAAELRAQQDAMFPKTTTSQPESFDDIVNGASRDADPSTGGVGMDGTDANDDVSNDVSDDLSEDLFGEASGDQVSPEVNDNRHVLLKVLGDDPPLRIIVLIIVAACILAPIVEELFFRGLLFATMASRFGVPIAALLSGALFGAAHFDVVPLRLLPVLGTLGVLLAVLRHHTNSLLPGMAVHAFVNGLGTGISAGFGIYTIALIVGSWLVIAVVVRPFVRRNSIASQPLPTAA